MFNQDGHTGPAPVSEGDFHNPIMDPPETADGSTFHPWTDGWGVGFQVRKPSYQDSFISFSPDEVDGEPVVIVYEGHVDYEGNIVKEAVSRFPVTMLPSKRMEATDV